MVKKPNQKGEEENAGDQEVYAQEDPGNRGASIR